MYVQIREGSVVVVVELVDKSDQTGANITVLVYQLQEDVSALAFTLHSNYLLEPAHHNPVEGFNNHS